MRQTSGKRLAGILCLLTGCALFALPLFSYAAEIVFSPTTGTFPAEEEFLIKVTVTPGADEKVNAADGTISFDPEALSVTGISKDGSAFSLWTADPTFSNGEGTVTFSGGTPTAFTTESTVITIKFKGKKVGSASLTVSKGSVLAADGKGTDVYKKGADATYTIGEAAAAPPEEETNSVVDGEKPPLPVISSLTHPKVENWYSTSTVEFSWKPTSDVTTVKILLSDAEDATPTVTRPITVLSERQFEIKDGIWYAIVQFKNDVGWSDIAKRKIQIDTVPPAEFDIMFIEGDAPKLKFEATDEMSGVDKYDIIIGETLAASIKPADLTDGTFPVPPQEGGAQKVTIKAQDKAGNIREVKKELTLPLVVKKGKGEEEKKESIWTVSLILNIIFAMLIGGVIAWNMYTRKNATEEKLKILREVALARDKNDKIFSAMREEFEELINELDERPQLTPAERDFLENMKEALEISEELIDTGMEDLKKMIHG